MTNVIAADIQMTYRLKDNPGHQPPESPTRPDGKASASDKQMQTFRMPRELVAFIKTEATRGGRDLTSHVVRWLDAYRTYFGLPEAARALLERDRQALEMERFEYLLHVLYQRSLRLRESGPGFDGPEMAGPKKP